MRKAHAYPLRVIIPILLPIVSIVIIFLFRGTIATTLAHREFEARGLYCDDLHASVDSTLSTVSIAPTRCNRNEGLIEAVEITEIAEAELSWFQPQRVSIPNLRVILRENEVRNARGWAERLRQLNIEEKVASVLKGVAELSAEAWPQITILNTTIVRGGRTMALARLFTLTPQTENNTSEIHLAGERLAFPAASLGQLELNSIRIESTVSHVNVLANASIRIGIGILSASQEIANVRVFATNLNTAEPQFSLEVSR